MELTEKKVIISSRSKKHSVLYESARRRGLWPVTVGAYLWIWNIGSESGNSRRSDFLSGMWGSISAKLLSITERNFISPPL